MAENKTKITNEPVDNYFAQIDDQTRRQDCETLAGIMARATHQPPKMWGAIIVGFGIYHYKYTSGREGDSCLTGFSARKGDISIYLMANFPGRDELFSKLGKYKTGKGCVYIRRLSDVDTAILEQAVAASAEERIRHYGQEIIGE